MAAPFDRWPSTLDSAPLSVYGVCACVVMQLANTNEITSSRGAVGLTSGLESDTQVRVVPNPFVGVRGDTKVGGEVNTGVEVSKKVGDVAVLDFKTALPTVSAGGVYGSVLPGTVVKEREGEPSDDNVAIRTNAPALFGYFGKKH